MIDFENDIPDTETQDVSGEEVSEQPAAGKARAKNSEASGASESSEESSEGLEENQEDGLSDEGEAKDGEKRKKSGFKKRIDRLNKQKSDLQREMDYWKQEALKAKGGQGERAEPVKEPKGDGRPKADDFETHEEYVEELAAWRADQRWKENEAKARESQVKSEHQRKVEAYQQKVEKLKEEIEDYDDVMESVDDVRVPVAVQQLLLESENGHELTYELAKNREELERICGLSPLAAARALGAFEASLAKKAQSTKQIKTTKAPPPLNPVGSKGAAAKGFRADMTLAEYEKWIEEQ